jgi:methylenetetrahydrofolate dehydrogenase (NADP+)/methenyltetrahydrofolate cyclohydrolase
MQIIDGRKIRDEILHNVAKEIKKLSFVPVFSDILIGTDPVSAQYVRMKARTAESIGIRFHTADFPSSITTEQLLFEIEKINNIENICGAIVQLPIPETLDKTQILNAIDPSIDVDSLGAVAGLKFYEGNTSIGFPTALACMAILDSLNLDLKGKNVVVIGQGQLVGKPVTYLLESRGLKVGIVTRKTENKIKEDLIKKADVIISATGAGKFITGDMIKKGVVIIDAGTSESSGGIVGDVDLESVADIAGFVSPVPGGVGPVTVAMLLQNVLTVAKQK